MTAEQEQEMHDLAVRLEKLTQGTGWEAMRYAAVGATLAKLEEYCGPDAMRSELLGPKPLTRPTVHMNGTSREDLLDGYLKAYWAIRNAREVVILSGPHGRDYYPQGDHAINRATQEHVSRVRRLEDIQLELSELANAVSR